MKRKGILILVCCIVAFIILAIASVAGSNNRAISLEEQVKKAQSSVEVQEKRRVDLIGNLVDTVLSYAKYEQETLEKVTQARADAVNGNPDQAVANIKAVAEAYPDLKADANYTQLMTELATTENLIASNRDNLNMQVSNYNKFVKSFPNNIWLGIAGYERIDFAYLEYNAPADAPQNLFEGKQ